MGAANNVQVGTVSLLQGPDQEYELKRMYVDSSVRGAGIGSALVQELLRHAKKQDCKSIKLITSGGLGQGCVWRGVFTSGVIRRA